MQPQDPNNQPNFDPNNQNSGAPIQPTQTPPNASGQGHDWFAAPNIPAPIQVVETKKPLISSKILIGLLGGLLLIAALILGFSLYNNSKYQLQSRVYDNGLGQKYQLDFYKKSFIEKAEGDEKVSSSLISEISKGKEAPLFIEIASIEDISENPEIEESYYAARDCSDDMPQAFTVKNQSVDEDIRVCKFKVVGKSSATYIGAFESNGLYNVFFIGHDVDSETLYDEEATSEIEGLVGLEKYKDDVSQIIASIKLLN